MNNHQEVIYKVLEGLTNIKDYMGQEYNVKRVNEALKNLLWLRLELENPKLKNPKVET